MSSIVKQFDIVWIKAEPHSGKEAGGHDQRHPYRPVLVLSHNKFNNNLGLIECMPITSHNHMKPPFNTFLIPLKTVSHQIHGFIVPFEIMCYDYYSRKGRVVDHWQPTELPTVKTFMKYIFDDNAQ